MSAPCISVSPMKSRPLSILSLRTGSMSKWKLLPDGEITVCSARSTLIMWLPPLASSISWATSSGFSTTGSRPLLKQLLLKMSAKLVEITHRIPKSISAHGACSRELPQPKLSPAISTDEPLYSGLLSTKSAISTPSPSKRKS
jgi:hypothetical protein